MPKSRKRRSKSKARKGRKSKSRKSRSRSKSTKGRFQAGVRYRASYVDPTHGTRKTEKWTYARKYGSDMEFSHNGSDVLVYKHKGKWVIGGGATPVKLTKI